MSSDYTVSQSVNVIYVGSIELLVQYSFD